MFLNQVVAVKKYYPVLPAVPKNRSERKKTVKELHNDCDDKLNRGWNTDGHISSIAVFPLLVSWVTTTIDFFLSS